MQDAGNSGAAVLVVLIFFGAFVYFLPAIVGSARQHRNRLAIFVLNLVAGWTALGWIVALVWACTANTEPDVTANPQDG